MVIFDKFLKMGILFGPEIILLGIYPKIIIKNVGKVICTELFITVIFFLINAQEFGFC